ncbi:transcription factor bHLH61-like isoform X2 [Olea europaea var. sylvestris]|uniref:Transcription factor bHLH61-like isoform X2 n=1 Tax=Olea europaea subsp. europaea TaxID=158383 RepID=A0A8S0TRY9_OLEEU|nr:transcription factor bHLH61-like isoform X2 [Olea europaea var. sylvestris]CAA3006723.1 transcription factor bHLH61-like isoform X2 [Olea europaea subsp. europaea]
MDSNEHKKAALYEKLEQLRSATNSTAMNTASIVVDASRYIEELKERVERLDQDVVTLQNSNEENSLTAVKVESLEKGFLINVFSEKNCPGLLVSILEAFEELGLEVLDARVSCSDNFRLEAVSEADSIDAQVVKQAVLQAIRNWSVNNEQD